MPAKKTKKRTTKKTISNKQAEDSIRLDQVFLGIVVGMLLTAVMIGVITFYSVQEANQKTLERLNIIQERLEELDAQEEILDFPQ